MVRPIMQHPTMHQDITHHIALPSSRWLALCAVIAGCASLVHAETVTVCLGGSCDFTGPVTAVEAAAEGDTIEIAAGTYLLSSPISLYNKNLVIRGAVDANGRPTNVLNGQNTTYHINLIVQTSATVIENLVLTNGRSTVAGSIYTFGANGTMLRNCSVRGNQRGAIKFNSSSVTLIS